jgi:hypothetical protein
MRDNHALLVHDEDVGDAGEAAMDAITAGYSAALQSQ